MSALRETTGTALGAQVLVLPLGETPSAQRLKAVINRPTRPKPDGGLWTSSWLDPEHVSGWVDWCRNEQWGDHDLTVRSVWLLDPEPSARLLEVHTGTDLRRLLGRWSVSYDFGTPLLPPNLTPDFEAIAREYDGLHLTEEGQWRTRLMEPDLYGWDCESTLWFRWAFIAVRPWDTAVADRLERELA